MNACERLRRALRRAQRRGTSLHEIGRRAGYDVAGVSRFVNGWREDVRLSVAEKLARAAGYRFRLEPRKR